MENLSTSLGEINKVRKSRKTRAGTIITSVIPIIKSLRGFFVDWCENEIKDISKEIKLVKNLPTIEKERINEIEGGLKKVEKEFKENKEKLDELLKSVDDKTIASIYEVDFETVIKIFEIINNVESIKDSINRETKNIFNTITLLRALITTKEEIPEMMFV